MKMSLPKEPVKNPWFALVGGGYHRYWQFNDKRMMNYTVQTNGCSICNLGFCNFNDWRLTSRLSCKTPLNLTTSKRYKTFLMKRTLYELSKGSPEIVCVFFQSSTIQRNISWRELNQWRVCPLPMHKSFMDSKGSRTVTRENSAIKVW